MRAFGATDLGAARASAVIPAVDFPHGVQPQGVSCCCVALIHARLALRVLPGFQLSSPRRRGSTPAVLLRCFKKLAFVSGSPPQARIVHRLGQPSMPDSPPWPSWPAWTIPAPCGALRGAVPCFGCCDEEADLRSRDALISPNSEAISPAWIPAFAGMTAEITRRAMTARTRFGGDGNAPITRFANGATNTFDHYLPCAIRSIRR